MLPSRVYAQIDLGAIRRNIDEIRRAAGVGVMAVIKANAYGHGAVEVAKALRGRAAAFGVATADEALALRQAGIEEPILILGYCFADQWQALIQNDISLTVFDEETAGALSELAVRLGRTVKLHIKADTGMSRLGLRPNAEGVETVRRIAALSGLEIAGLFSHFARADEPDKTAARAQLAQFTAFADALKAAGVSIPCLHISNSAGITELPEARFSMVRCGIATYGLYPSDEVDQTAVHLLPAMSLHTRVSFVKRVPAGTPVSYGGTYVTERETVIATLPVGYADGYPRSLSGKGYVLLHGRQAPVLGRICMDQFMVDVTDIPDVRRGDEVILMGEGVPAETLAALSGRFRYELLCDISERVPRVYL